MRGARALCIVFFLLVSSSTARSAPGEIILGARGVVETSSVFGGDARLQLGLSDTLALSAELGGRHETAASAGRCALGIAWAFDALSLVPEVGLYAGVRLAPEARAEAAIELGVRRYLALTLAVSFTASYGVRAREGGFGMLGLGLWYTL